MSLVLYTPNVGSRVRLILLSDLGAFIRGSASPHPLSSHLPLITEPRPIPIVLYSLTRVSSLRARKPAISAVGAKQPLVELFRLPEELVIRFGSERLKHFW